MTDSLSEVVFRAAIDVGLIPNKDVVLPDLLPFHQAMAQDIYTTCLSNNPSLNAIRRMVGFSAKKGMEQRVAAEVYGNSERASAYDFYINAEEGLDPDRNFIVTQLPKHLDDAVASLAIYADKLAASVVSQLNDASREAIISVLATSALVGDYIAFSKRIAVISIKGYPNWDLITMEEARRVAGSVFEKQYVAAEGGTIYWSHYERNVYVNIGADFGGEKRAYLLRASIYPNKVGFLQEELDHFFDMATNNGCIPYVVTAAVASTDNNHFNDGVVLSGDKKKVVITCCQKLELE